MTALHGKLYDFNVGFWARKKLGPGVQAQARRFDVNDCTCAQDQLGTGARKLGNYSTAPGIVKVTSASGMPLSAAALTANRAS